MVLVAAAVPLSGDEPDFVVVEPFAGPGDCGVSEEHGGSPLAGEVQADGVVGVGVGQDLRRAVEDELGGEDMDFGNAPIAVADADGIATACRGRLDAGCRGECVAVEADAGVGEGGAQREGLVAYSRPAVSGFHGRRRCGEGSGGQH